MTNNICEALSTSTLEQLSQCFLLSRDIVSLLNEVYGSQLLQVLKALKKPPSSYSIRINTLKTTRNTVLENFARKGIHATVHPEIPEALLIDVKGPFDVEPVAKRVVVDKFAAEAALLGSHVYAPGVKRCQRLRRGDAVSICDIHGQIVATGVARMNETEILRQRAGLAVEVQESKYYLASFRESEDFQHGWIYLQSIPAMLVARTLDPQPDETIVDLCCAPGGKLSHVAQLTQGKSRLIGFDRNMRKIEATHETLKRLGCSNYTLHACDSRYVDKDYPHLAADECIVDPPCTAFGVVPQLYNDSTLSEVEAASNYQKQFLKAAAKVVKPGGKIVYSVCTLTPQECEQVVKYAHDEIGLTVERPQPFIGCEGFREFFEQGPQTQRFHPHIHGAGFYIATLSRPS
ncbi:MAG: PUA domain-containing protein [Candidatus Bathyarchaeia archaeon]